MVTLLALLPVLTPSPQALAAPLSSGPNPSDFGIRQHGFNPRAKRSIVPLIEGVANYWLRLAEINATPGRLVWVQINGVSSKREGKTRKKEPLTVFAATETPATIVTTTTTTPKPVTPLPSAKTTKPPAQTTIHPQQSHTHNVHIVEPLLPPAPVLPLVPAVHPIPPQSISIHPIPPQSIPIHATPPQSSGPHPVHEPPTFLRLPRRAVYPGQGIFMYKNERSSSAAEIPTYDTAKEEEEYQDLMDELEYFV